MAIRILSILDAYAEAERRWPTSWGLDLPPGERERRWCKQSAFVDGARWLFDMECYNGPKS